MMRSCGVILATLSLMTATDVLAASDCPVDPAIGYDIELKIDIPEPRLHHNLGIAELDRRAPHGPGKRVLGLADIGLEFGWVVRFEWQPRGEAYCFWVRRTELVIRHPSPDIYVAREYRRGTCPYQAILAHERQHMSTSRAQINRFLPRLRWVLTSLRIPTGARPIFVTSAEAAKTEVRALMKELAEPLFREIGQSLLGLFRFIHW